MLNELEENMFEYYMSLNYKMNIIEDEDEGGFTVYFPELPGCITCGSTLESALVNAEDAKREWLAAAIQDKIKIKDLECAENF